MYKTANDDYKDAVSRLKNAGLQVVTHIIISLPGDDPVRTTNYTVESGTDGVKFHLLHILQNTRLAKEYEAGRVEALTLNNYLKKA